jgi:Mrp family chromosome partitioning ATPase
MIDSLANSFVDEFHKLERALFSKGRTSGFTVQFTSSHSGEGVTSVTLAFAKFLAAIYGTDSVVAIEANLRKPSFHKILEIPCENNLRAALTKESPIEKSLQVCQKNGIHVIPAGPVPQTDDDSSYARLLQNFGDIVTPGLRKKFSYLLVDSPPVVPFVDSLLVCRAVDGVVLVVESGLTRSEVVQHALDKLKSGQANMLGTILNKRELHIPKWLYRFL